MRNLITFISPKMPLIAFIRFYSLRTDMDEVEAHDHLTGDYTGFWPQGRRSNSAGVSRVSSSEN